jgi:hypothetical protein
MKQQCFCPVARCVSGQNGAAAEFLTQGGKFLVTPGSGSGFCARLVFCVAADLKIQVLPLAPRHEFGSNGCGSIVPTMVAVPKLKVPIMQMLKPP